MRGGGYGIVVSQASLLCLSIRSWFSGMRRSSSDILKRSGTSVLPLDNPFVVEVAGCFKDRSVTLVIDLHGLCLMDLKINK